MKKSNSGLDEKIFGKEKLPEMLNVLTIMTIGYSSLMVISGIINLFILPNVLNDINSQINDNQVNISEIDNPILQSLLRFGLDAIEFLPLLNLLQIVVAIICITSAILMRKLRKLGFYLYFIGVLLEILVPIFLMGTGLSAGFILIGSFFSILFIILYGVNLKHLK
ncbi:MAG: hypothetical protein ACPGVD_00480 [Flavobacteriales bacterium]